MALHEAVSNQHHPAIHTFQTVFFGGGLRGRPFQQVQKKSGAGNFWTITRETLQWLCKVIWGLRNRPRGEHLGMNVL